MCRCLFYWIVFLTNALIRLTLNSVCDDSNDKKNLLTPSNDRSVKQNPNVEFIMLNEFEQDQRILI